MEVFVGTSGWSYGWNRGSSLEWYVQESGLNAVELNMSYYRFPFPNMVASWAKKGKNLAWVIKVNRQVTHYSRLNPKSYPTFRKFLKTFEPLDEYIHYYLLQLPPRFRDLDAVAHFAEEFAHANLAVEFRDASVFTDEVKRWGKEHGVLLVSVDAPDLPLEIMSEKHVYERIHGRTGWYDHDYSASELKEIRDRILATNPHRVHVFFNNNHAMLKNAQQMYKLYY
ncbi:MAG: DUF72 domain-containing protein [Thermoplasmata archaeon]|nr:MAG: DUF72 domain-containing protein [Thermoplasmata archaeon]